MVLVRQFTLTPGTYRVTGVLEAGTSAGASLQVRIGGGSVGSTDGGVLGPGIGLCRLHWAAGAAPPLVTEACGGRFLTAGTGTLEWSATFGVANPINRDDPCL